MHGFLFSWVGNTSLHCLRTIVFVSLSTPLFYESCRLIFFLCLVSFRANRPLLSRNGGFLFGVSCPSVDSPFCGILSSRELRAKPPTIGKNNTLRLPSRTIINFSCCCRLDNCYVLSSYFKHVRIRKKEMCFLSYF